MTDLLARDRAHLIHPQHDRSACDAAHVWIKGHGAVLTDAGGMDYLDGLAGLWNVIAGHGRAELADAARDQMIALGFASGYAGGSNRPAIELAERLAALTYSSINHFFFTSGGAEANESAIKIARSFWKSRGKPAKTKVISRELGYHGVTLAAMSATGLSAYWPRFEPRVPGFIHIPALSADALEVAKRNVADHGLAKRIRLRQGDLFAPLQGERYDLIISNPPYVDAEGMDGLPAECSFEPKMAFDGGPDGIDLVRRILSGARAHLNEDGSLLCEIGRCRPALEEAYPRTPFLWLDTEESEGEVFWLNARDLPV